MLEKYINKKVEISEKVFDGVSCLDGKFSGGGINKTVGTVTGFDDKFIELDNEKLIAIAFIYRIRIVD